MKPIDPDRPDLELTLPLDPYAPRAARYYVAQVDRPSPDLRDAVVLLTSELVTRAVQHTPPGDQTVELRAWMPADVVRIELRAPGELLREPSHDDPTDYAVRLLDQLADRWSLERSGVTACMWFEIDRHPPAAAQSAQGTRERAGSLS